MRLSIKSKLAGFSDKEFEWQRLAITPADFTDPELLGFPVKRGGKEGSWRPYVETHGDRCVEIDALNPDEVRRRIRDTIESHIDADEWEALKVIEEVERKTLKEAMLSIS